VCDSEHKAKATAKARVKPANWLLLARSSTRSTRRTSCGLISAPLKQICDYAVLCFGLDRVTQPAKPDDAQVRAGPNQEVREALELGLAFLEGRVEAVEADDDDGADRLAGERGAARKPSVWLGSESGLSWAWRSAAR